MSARDFQKTSLVGEENINTIDIEDTEAAQRNLNPLCRLSVLCVYSVDVSSPTKLVF